MMETDPKMAQQQKYPNIKDYDSLRYAQLRYQFCDHDFIPLQWKAMQFAGWTYSSGIYKSPKGTRSYDNVNVMQHQFDMLAVRPIIRTLAHVGNVLNNNAISSEATIATADYDMDKEQMNDLRNDVVYNMQLLIERHHIVDDDVNVDNTRTIENNYNCPDEDDDAGTQPKSSLNVVATMRTRNTARTSNNITSVTAIEKGSDLYLHRKRKSITAAAAASRMKHQMRTKNNRSTVAGISSTNTLMKQQQNLEKNTNHKLPSLPSQYECSHLLSKFGDVDDVCQTIEAQYQNDFQRWKFLLSTNHSLLLYGNGSKYELLSKFCRTQLCYKHDGYCLQIDGYDSEISMDYILDLLVSTFLNGTELMDDAFNYSYMNAIQRSENVRTSMQPPHSVPIFTSANNSTRATIDRAFNIARALAEYCIKSGSPIYLVIHSLDGNLSTDIEQDALAALIYHSVVPGDHTSSRALRLVASIDHVDAIAALWCTETWNQLSWIYLDVHTYRPYAREMALLTTLNEATNTDQSKAIQRRVKQLSRTSEQSERVLQVLKNLAPRYGEVMQILAQLQLVEMEKEHHDSNTSSQHDV